MTKNEFSKKIFFIAFAIILALPVLTWAPYFFPPDFSKNLIFRSIMAIMLLVLLAKTRGLTAAEPLKKSPILWVLGAFLGVFLLAGVFSVDPLFSFWGSPARGGGIVNLIFYAIFSVLAFSIIKKDDWKKLWAVAIFAGIFVSFVAIAQYYGLFKNILAESASEPASTLGNPILMAIYLLLLFFLALSFALSEKNKILKIFYFVCLPIFLFAILISGTRADYIGIAMGIVVFLLLFPKKIKFLKPITAILLLAGASVVIYANFNYALLSKSDNRIIQSLARNLSVKSAIGDERFAAWKLSIKAIEEKPLLGWGPENFSIAFDKYYDPQTIGSNWWDRAHNAYLNVAVESGLLGLIFYLLLFIAIYYQLHKIKNLRESNIISGNPIIATGLQAGLTGYLVANFFSFDGYGSYIILFFILGYVMYLYCNESFNDTYKNTQSRTQNNTILRKSVFLFVLIFVIVFVWQYNLVPFLANTQINKANALAQQKKCDKALELIEKTIKNKTFLDAYARMEYVGVTKTCSEFAPEKVQAYLKRGSELILKATKIRPSYTRSWIYLGDSAISLNLLLEAEKYFKNAMGLSPKRQETQIGLAKLIIAEKDFTLAENYAENCIKLNPNFGECYWQMAIVKIYQKNFSEAEENIKKSESAGYSIHSKSSLKDLYNAYGETGNWAKLAPALEELLLHEPQNFQLRSTLAFAYKNLGEYKKAREQANEVLRLSPESKENVEEFLRTLPY